jgi:APA family basic amino acid/polyamine antiporter
MTSQASVQKPDVNGPGASARSDPPRFLDLRAATMLVIANMIGTGVFTTLGLQAEGVPDGAALLLLWLLGGLIALCGALSYAELAAALGRSGGEYAFLTRIYGPELGEMAGWVSITVGFGAPVALSAMAFALYAATVIPVDPLWLGLGAVVITSALHAFDVDLGRRFQVIATLLKILLILLFCTAGLLSAPAADTLIPLPTGQTPAAILSPAFALSLIYVSYAYAGWNAATYVTGEVRSAQRQVPRALVLGTLTVTALYLLLNLVFLRHVPLPALGGTVEVGALAAESIFGVDGGRLMSLALSLLLLSTISAMVLAGPRVIEAMAEDRPRMALLGARGRGGAPTRAVLLLETVAVGLILTDSFSAVLAFAGFTLMLFSLLTVLGVLRLRRREPALARPFRVPLYPLPPLVYSVLTMLTLVVVAWSDPVPVLGGVGLLVLWWVALRRRRTASRPSGP